MAAPTNVAEVPGRWIAPAAGRSWWWAIVACPQCGQEHLHHDPHHPERDGWLRGCPDGSPYRVMVGAQAGDTASRPQPDNQSRSRK